MSEQSQRDLLPGVVEVFGRGENEPLPFRPTLELLLQLMRVERVVVPLLRYQTPCAYQSQ